MNNEPKIIEIETLKNLLVSHSTGGSADNNEYIVLRQKLTQDSEVKTLLPRFVFTCRSLSEFWGYIKEVSSNYQGRRNHLREEFNNVLEYLEEQKLNNSPIDDIFNTTLNEHNVHQIIRDQWEKGLERRKNDPEGAITIARSMIESTCKFILDSEGELYDDSSDLPKLYKLVQKKLNLAPDQHTEPLFKQILGGTASIVQGLGAIRNKISDAHGPGIISYKPSQRHAQLAVNLAGSMSDFLIYTWKEKK
ncbi:abortive infection family protein [Anaerobacillus sp. 1_MG-2023]|uniref:abortive infection family protein n=1 Tax=Anaerobacillus sp. 1_MG-2023 TaxID=3062655 RepID=UPI0026E313CD|nr:abortive infection family protein [Anaerobacillus sp. 1_MG-2023]MDO6657453.1 abortive infection family protein [Anaerobacillus sp. 1_MG-2023]